jgi:hypothetical protein
MSVQHVCKWCREFKDRRTDVHDEQRSGRLSVSEKTIAKVEETMLKDRRVTVRELCEMIPDVRKTRGEACSRRECVSIRTTLVRTSPV